MNWTSLGSPPPDPAPTVTAFELSAGAGGDPRRCPRFRAERAGAARRRMGRGEAFPGRDAARARPDLAWPASMSRRSVGGSGLGRLDAALIFEALAAGCPSTAAFSRSTTWLLDDRPFRRRATRREWLPRLCTMGWLASYCLTEPGSGSDAARCARRAQRDGTHYVLNGAKRSSRAPATALTSTWSWRGPAGRGPAASRHLSCRESTPGLSFGAHEKKMGWNAQPTRTVTFDDCRVPVANRIGAEGDGLQVRHGRARRRPAQHRRLLAGRGAGRAGRALLPDMRERRRSAAARRFPGAAVPARRHGDRARRGAADGATARRPARRRSPDATLFSAPWPSGSPPTSASRSPTRRCSCMAATATSGTTGSRDRARLRVHQILEGTNEIMRVIIARAILGRGG